MLAHDACETINCHEEVLYVLSIKEYIHWSIQQQPEMESVEKGQRGQIMVTTETLHKAYLMARLPQMKMTPTCLNTRSMTLGGT